jgi:hypothetical protein
MKKRFPSWTLGLLGILDHCGATPSLRMMMPPCRSHFPRRIRMLKKCLRRNLENISTNKKAQPNSNLKLYIVWASCKCFFK